MNYGVQLVLLTLLALSSGQNSTSAVLAEVDRVFAYGGDKARDKQAFEMLERALKETPSDYQLLWRAGRSYYYLGDGAAGKERQNLFDLGMQFSMRAVAQKADGAEGHFWLGSNAGAFYNEKGSFTAFRSVGKVRSEFEAVLRLNAAYEDGSAYTWLGEIDRQLPKLFGGNLKRSIEYLETGMKLSPRNPEIRESLGEAYADAGRKEDARRELQETLQLPANANAHVIDNGKAQDKARKLLMKMGSK